jgi:hypothetical protein
LGVLHLLGLVGDRAADHLPGHDGWLKATTRLGPGTDKVETLQWSSLAHAPHHIVARWLAEAVDAATHGARVAHVGQRRRDLDHLSVLAQAGRDLFGQVDHGIGDAVLGVHIFGRRDLVPWLAIGQRRQHYDGGARWRDIRVDGIITGDHDRLRRTDDLHALVVAVKIIVGIDKDLVLGEP